MIHDKLTKIRELVDELYDNTEPHSSTISMLFLEINHAIDEAQTDCTHYINGTELDWNNELLVHDIMVKSKQELKL